MEKDLYSGNRRDPKKRSMTPDKTGKVVSSNKMKNDAKSLLNKSFKEQKDPREYGYEGEMAMSQLKGIMNHAKQLHDMLEPNTDLPEWVQSKITKAYDYIQTAADYMATEMKEEAPVNAAGAGNVAGLGVGPQGEPGVHMKRRKKTVLASFKRFTKA